MYTDGYFQLRSNSIRLGQHVGFNYILMDKAFIVIIFSLLSIKLCSASTQTYSCNVIIAGGSTAALGAAIAAARAGNDDSITVCLTEPTDWLGGQMTSSAVSAIDFGMYNRNWWFQSKTFQQMMDVLGTGNPGRCWVSTKCYVPKDLVENYIKPTISSLPNLRVFYNTVIKSVQHNGNKISAVNVIQRSERPGVNQWDYLLSDTLEDWYSKNDSARFTKQLIELVGAEDKSPIVIEATEFGDILALSEAGFHQGVETPAEDSNTTNDRCTQTSTIPFYIVYDVTPHSTDPVPNRSHGYYSLSNKPWGQIWSYRRSKGIQTGAYHEAHMGEISNQNWSEGNDFPDKTIFRSTEDTLAEINDWKGGIDVDALRLAESRAYGWYHFYKNHSSPPTIRPYLKLGLSDTVGTLTGLAKVPYIRDSRRSLGLQGFLLKKMDMDTQACQHPSPEPVPGDPGHALNCTQYATRFPDSVALGNYLADVHGVQGCSWPRYINVYTTLPFHIPFLALTNQRYSNLLVAGKNMAQSFMANAATRTHPTEFATGEAAGTAAILMLQNGFSTEQMYRNVRILQSKLSETTPIFWDKPRNAASKIVIG